MPCQTDGVKVFDTEEPYTVQCEACQKHCKIFHYRSCEERHKWNAEQGNDVFAALREADRIARHQMGQGVGLPPSPGKTENSPRPPSRHRGRR